MKKRRLFTIILVMSLLLAGCGQAGGIVDMMWEP